MLEGDGPRQSEKRPFTFTLASQQAEDIRWYLEDYRIYPVDPMPKTAKRIERDMREIGRELFRLLLGGSDVWTSVRGHLSDTRIEVETELADTMLPWELMRDPVADRPLALMSRRLCAVIPGLPGRTTPCDKERARSASFS